MQSAEQQTEQRERPRHGFQPGQSGNPRGKNSRRDAVADKVEEWTAHHGGLAAFNAAEIDLLRQAANLCLTRVRGAEERIRAAGKVAAILARLGLIVRRGGRREPQAGPGDLQSYLATRSSNPKPEPAA
jgi:hypothetical protein